MSLCFISHSASDDLIADRIALELSSKGIEPWLDHISIEAAADWTKAVGAALFSCDFGLYILSPRSAASEQCESEALTIKDRKRPLYVAFIADVEKSDLPYWVRAIQCVYLDKDWGKGMAALVKSMLNRSPLPPEMPLVVEKPGQLEPTLPGWRRVLIRLHDTYQDVKGQLHDLVSKLRRRLDIAIENFRIVFAGEGSTVLMIDVQESDADRILAVVEQEPGLFAGFTLESVELLRAEFVLPPLTEILANSQWLYSELQRQRTGLGTIINFRTFNVPFLSAQKRFQSINDSVEKGYYPPMWHNLGG